jgi:hypothetical protein
VRLEKGKNDRKGVHGRKEGLYAYRALGGNRDHCHTDGDIDARAATSQRTGPTCRVPE